MGERVRVRGVRKEGVMKELFNKSFSRRSFLTALGVGVGAAALDWEEIEVLAWMPAQISLSEHSVVRVFHARALKDAIES